MKDLLTNLLGKTSGASAVGIGGLWSGLVPENLTWPMVILFGLSILAFGAERVAKIIKGVPTDDK